MTNDGAAPPLYVPPAGLGSGSHALSAAEVAKELQRNRELIRATLRKGIDYGPIPGIKGQILFKSGAEILLAAFGLGHRLERLDIDRKPDDNNRVGVTYRATITRFAADKQFDVASCDGYAGRDETKLAKAPWHTVIRMAEKRALIGATLQATATSTLFDEELPR